MLDLSQVRHDACFEDLFIPVGQVLTPQEAELHFEALVDIWLARGYESRARAEQDLRIVIGHIAASAPPSVATRIRLLYKLTYTPTASEAYRAGALIAKMLQVYGVRRPPDFAADFKQLEDELALLDELTR